MRVILLIAVLLCLNSTEGFSGQSKKKRKNRFKDFPNEQVQAKRYVTCRTHAQLGNQLFELAVAIAYGLDHGCEMRFPTLQNSFEAVPPYINVLHRINASDFPPGVQFEIFEETPFTGLCDYREIPFFPDKNICFFGYFQSEKYFYRHREYIKELFSPTEEIVQQIMKQYGHLLQGPTVAVHLRTARPEGNTPDAFGNFGEFYWDYFVRAMQLFPEDHTFLVFSDSMEWAESHFPDIPRKCVFIKDNPLHIDFYLMSMCDHQIVSPRSTFSWWAAYLNKNVNKIVVAPWYWLGRTDSDAIPDEWLRIDLIPEFARTPKL